MLQKKVLADSLYLNAAHTVDQLLSVVRSVLVMRLLLPESYGTWAGLVIVLTYGAYVHLGVDHGMGNRLPYYRAQGNRERAEQVESTVYMAWTGLNALFALAVICYAVVAPIGSETVQFGLFVVAALVLIEQQWIFLHHWLAAHMNFALASRNAILKSVLSFLLIVPGAYFFGVAGVMVGTLVAHALTTATLVRQTGFRPRWRFSGDVLREMLRIGFPLLLVSLAGVLIQTIDRVVILATLGAASLGYYGITGLGGAFLYGVLHKAGNALSPHIVEEMGRSHDSPQALRKFLVKPTLIFAYASAVMITVIIFAAPPIVELLLPKYLPGLQALYFFVPGFFFLGVILTASNILALTLIARKRQRIMLYIQAASILVQVVCAFGLIRMGWGIAGAAMASTVAYAFYGTSVLSLTAYYVLLERGERLRFLSAVMQPFVYGVAVILVVFWLGSEWVEAPLVLRSAVQISLCLLAWLPLLVRLDSRMQLRRELAPFAGAFRTRILALFPSRG